MNRLLHTKMKTARRKVRVRHNVVGTTERPRLTVHISNRNVIAQIIDDSVSKTLAHASSVNVNALNGKTMTEKAAWVGEQIAKSAQKAKVKQVVFDRGGRLYHGKVKALADSARENGLEF